jgi:hypothetical protein
MGGKKERAMSAIETAERPARQERNSARAAELRAHLDRLRELVETDRVREARALIPELVAKWPASRAVQGWEEALAPPRARINPDRPPLDVEADRQWLKAHAHEYPGRWMAVHGGQLIALADDHPSLLEAARTKLGHDHFVVFFHPARYP